MIYIGTSGWSYDHWHPVLYPPGMLPRERLGIYLQRYQTVELNSSFYKWTNPQTFGYWRRKLPPGFQMSIKAPRYLTHTKRLYSPERWIDRISKGLSRLGDKRGILLVQLSPLFEYDRERLHYFLQSMPLSLRTTIEFRHPSWHHDEVYSMLERFNIAYCVTSGAYLPCVLRCTADFVYVRLHGPDHHHLYAGSYSDADLYWWADRCLDWQRMGKDVYVYFNNDGFGNAVRNADTLKRFVYK